MASRWPALIPTLLAAACIGTPQPDPPNVDPDRLFTTGERGTSVLLVGGAGAVEPAGASLRIANLETGDPVVAVAVGEDGAFSAVVEILGSDELRLWAVAGEERSEPVDIVLSDPVVRAPRPLAECFRTRPALEAFVEEGRDLALELVNDCDEPLGLSRASLREPDAPFSVGPAPGAIEAGGSAILVVAFAPVAAEPAEAILIVEVDAPVADRRPVTLVGRPAEP